MEFSPIALLWRKKKKRNFYSMFRFEAKKMFSFFFIVSIVLFFVAVCYSLCLIMGSVALFKVLFCKIGFSLGARALSVSLFKLGCSRWIALEIPFAVRGIAGESPDLALYMLPGSSHEPHEPSADSSSAPSALDQRKHELIKDNLQERKGALGDGQEVSEVRQAVEQDFKIQNKGDEFELVKQMEKEAKTQKEDCPVTNSMFNEIKEYESQIQDGRGGGKPKDCSNQKDKDGELT